MALETTIPITTILPTENILETPITETTISAISPKVKPTEKVASTKVEENNKETKVENKFLSILLPGLGVVSVLGIIFFILKNKRNI